MFSNGTDTHALLIDIADIIITFCLLAQHELFLGVMKTACTNILFFDFSGVPYKELIHRITQSLGTRL